MDKDGVGKKRSHSMTISEQQMISQFPVHHQAPVGADTSKYRYELMYIHLYLDVQVCMQVFACAAVCVSIGASLVLMITIHVNDTDV